MPFRVVIPARYDSSRLPGKVLLPLAGKPMLQWVHERARDSKAAEVIIATDDERIAEAARGFTADVALTGRTHVSGTDRIAEVAATRGWRDDDIVVNVQGDEPLIPPAVIDQVAALLHAHARADIATLAARIDQVADLNDPNNVKVACDASGRALYFSRAPIPWNRDAVNTLTPASLRLIVSDCCDLGLLALRETSLSPTEPTAGEFFMTLSPTGAGPGLSRLDLLRAVEGELAPDRDALDVLLATFPAGTVAGAPKLRAIEILDRLEPEARGPYAGATGYLSFTGDLDACITIRTLVARETASGREVSVTAGAGIVADSDPESERLETENKAAGLLAAVALAERLEGRS